MEEENIWRFSRKFELNCDTDLWNPAYILQTKDTPVSDHRKCFGDDSCQEKAVMGPDYQQSTLPVT